MLPKTNINEKSGFNIWGQKSTIPSQVVQNNVQRGVRENNAVPTRNANFQGNYGRGRNYVNNINNQNYNTNTNTNISQHQSIRNSDNNSIKTDYMSENS